MPAIEEANEVAFEAVAAAFCLASASSSSEWSRLEGLLGLFVTEEAGLPRFPTFFMPGILFSERLPLVPRIGLVDIKFDEVDEPVKKNIAF